MVSRSSGHRVPVGSAAWVVGVLVPLLPRSCPEPIALQMLEKRGGAAVLVGVARVHAALGHLLQAVMTPATAKGDGAGRTAGLHLADHHPGGLPGSHRPAGPAHSAAGGNGFLGQHGDQVGRAH